MSLAWWRSDPTRAWSKNGRNWSQQKGVMQKALSMSEDDRQDPQKWEGDACDSERLERCRFHSKGQKDQHRTWVVFLFPSILFQNDKHITRSNTELSRGERDQKEIWVFAQRESIDIFDNSPVSNCSGRQVGKVYSYICVLGIACICDTMIEYRSKLWSSIHDPILRQGTVSIVIQGIRDTCYQIGKILAHDCKSCVWVTVHTGQHIFVIPLWSICKDIWQGCLICILFQATQWVWGYKVHDCWWGESPRKRILSNFQEVWDRSMERQFWKDGTQDCDQVASQ